MSAAASCSPGSVHLSACVSARLAVWRPLQPTLPDSEREQSHYFSHGGRGQPLIHPPTCSRWRLLQGLHPPPPLSQACVLVFFMVSPGTCSHFTHFTMRNHRRGKRQAHAAITTHPNTEVGDLQPSLSSGEQKRLEPRVEEIDRKGKKIVSQI